MARKVASIAPPVADAGFNDVMAALESEEVGTLCAALQRCGELLQTRQVDEVGAREIGRKLAQLAGDSRSQVRRAVVLALEHLRHPSFRPTALLLAEDDHSLVRDLARRVVEARSEGRRGDLTDPKHLALLRDGLLDLDTVARKPARRLAERYADELMRIADHEISKVLQPLLLELEGARRVLDEAIGATDLRETIERARSRVLVLRSITRSFRAYSAEASSAHRRHEPIALLLDEATQLVMERLRIKRRTALADVTFEVDLPTIEVHRERMVLALASLIQNAFESYANDKRGKRIEIAAGLDGSERLVVDVRDFGSGMTEDMKRKAFELGASSKGPGRGFGLPVALHIIEEEHGGRITVESTRGKGTTVRMSLPVSSKEME